MTPLLIFRFMKCGAHLDQFRCYKVSPTQKKGPEEGPGPGPGGGEDLRGGGEREQRTKRRTILGAIFGFVQNESQLAQLVCVPCRGC